LFHDIQKIIEGCKPIKKDPNEKKINENNGAKGTEAKNAEPKAGPKVSGRLILELPHVLQVVHLRHKPSGKRLIACNTHLYWHPRGSNVRMMQIHTSLRLVKREKELAEKEESSSVGIVYCGDFNNVAIGTTIRHALGSPITGNEVDMFSSGKAGVFKLETPLQTPIVMKSAIEPIHNYSNYVGPFIGNLDYIFYNGMKRFSSCNPFDHDDVTKRSGLPSEYFPSDHLAQVAVLEFPSDDTMETS